MYEDIKLSIIIGFILTIIISGVFYLILPKDVVDKMQKEKPYNSETYKDEEVIYKIIKDREGDVIYCEPME